MYEIVLAIVIGVILVFAIYSTAFMLLMKLTNRIRYLQEMETRPWRSNIIIGPVVLLAAIVVIVISSGGDLAEWGCRFPSWEHIITSLIVGVIAGSIVTGIQTRLSKVAPEDRPRPDLRTFIILIVVIASIAEEFVFRGALQQYIDHFAPYVMWLGTVPVSIGCIVAAIVFGLVHITPARQMGESASLMAGGAGVLGAIAGIMFVMTASIVIPIVIHMTFNLVGWGMEQVAMKRTAYKGQVQ
ncbi:MAG: CPBP family intramembrane metalloprotease [Candidatus Thorarchaeota archaeon]|nr:CPBP family intramembrane metalloprotease [Candidatus Thorarchaeota archaeon]